MKPFYDEGVHVGLVTAQGLSKAKSGTPQFFLRFKVLGLPDGEDNYNPHAKQYERTVFMAITEGTVKFVVEALEAIGYQHSTFGPLDPSHPEYQSFSGQYVRFYCKHEEYKGEYQEKWQISRPMEAKPLDVQPLSSKEMRQLDSLFGKNLKGKAQPAAVPASTVQANNHGQYIDDDDIPF